MSPSAALKCTLCGYVHRGTEPPDACPVCGAGADAFETVTEDLAPAPAAVSRWRCLVCDYVHEGPRPPDECPVCGAAADQFEPTAESAAAASGSGSGRLVVVGAGIAGLAAAEAAASAGMEVALISKESELPYYRLNLTRFLAGEIGEEDLPVHPEGWYRERGIDLRRGVEVSRIEADGQAVLLDDGGRAGFDRLLLTAGAHPFVPPIPGADLDGVTCLRSAADARHLVAQAGPGARCVCIGGGILGLETAGALARRGARVALLESFAWLLPRQLNRRAGEVLHAYVAGLGIEVRYETRTAAIVGAGRASGVNLEGGDALPADVVVVATGVRPNSSLARQAGLAVDKGVVVDDHLATSDPRILAAGDVAEHRGVLYGTWMAALSQGRIAGMCAAGLAAGFGGIPRSNTLKVLGVDLFSVGQVEPDDASYLVVEEEEDGRYYRFLFRDHRLTGAVLVGDATLAAPATQAIESRRDLSGLLRPTPSAARVRTALAG